MIKHCFVVTSAVNSRFGVYNPEQRLKQTLDTVSSIRSKVPDAKIVVMEVTGVPLREDQKSALVASSDVFLDFTDEEDVKSLYTSTNNWDVVKNSTEILCFGRALKLLKADGDFEGVDRIHKISGRYLLNDQFSVDIYQTMADKIIISGRRPSQFPLAMTQQPWQYMARLWSWPKDLLDEVISVYDQGLAHFSERVSQGGYTDIEHVLAKFLDPQHVFEVSAIGIEGTIAPNGVAIKD